MGSFGFGEILLIAIVGFIFLGPAKFQKFLKKAGEAFGVYGKIQNEIKDSVLDMKNSINKEIFDEEMKNIDLNKSEHNVNNIENQASIKNNFPDEINQDDKINKESKWIV